MSLSGVGTSSLDGAPVPYTAEWTAAPGNLTATFGYDETCDPSQPFGTPPLFGSAGGNFTVTGGTIVVTGGLPTPATLNGTFNWVRFGTAVKISLFTLSITTSSGTAAVDLLDALAGESAAGFLWTNGPGTCPANGQANQTAEVVGIALQPA